MAVYNGAQFLGETLDSLLAQSLTGFELIVIDDGSTDGTADILDNYASRDSRIIVRSQANQGRASALNNGLALARAPFIARIDADDIALPDRLELQCQFLKENADLAGVGGSLIFINEEGADFATVSYPLSPSGVHEAFSQRRTGLAHPAAMVRREVLEEVGGYRPAFADADDIDLWLRILDRHLLANLDQPVIRYRIHRNQATVVGLQYQALCCVAAHVAAKARRSGISDPFESDEQIMLETVLTHGGTMAEITTYFVESAAWLAKTTGRAGYASLADTLFRQARESARSQHGSPALVAMVGEARAARDREQGRWLRARIRDVRASIERRRRPGASGR